MATETVSESIDYTQEITRIVSAMPLREVAQIYEFVVSLQTQSEASISFAEDDEDWLNDSEEDMLAEDAIWEEVFARNAAVFAALDAETEAEIEAGITQPMFDADGELIIDELPYNAKVS